MTLIIYHIADHDGKGSAAIAKSVYPDAQTHGYNHDMEIPHDIISGHKRVIICDIALPVDYMFELNEKLDLIWIDHHISVINEYNAKIETGEFKAIKGLRRVGTAAIELTWEYFYPDKPVPEGIKLLALNDLFDLKDPRVRPFEYAVQSYGVNKPDSKIWKKLINNEINIAEAVSKGEGILSWIKTRNTRLVKELAFESEILGHKCICANMPQGYSEFYDSLENLDEYDVMINFYKNKHHVWKMTFYTTKKNVDVSEIAAHFGGGGHKMAAGASIKEDLPDFLKKGIKQRK